VAAVADVPPLGNPDEPTEEYLAEEAERFATYHRDRAHQGQPCDCPPTPIEYATEAPF